MQRRIVLPALLAAVLLVGAVVWFEPHKLLLDDVVDEELPSVAGSPAAADPSARATASEAPTPPQPVELASGSFGSLGRYTTTGEARVVALADGRQFLRLEGFATDNGPDLFVYLSSAAADGSGDFAADAVDLGELRGNIGDQNYELPEGIDLRRYSTVVIWCHRFTTAFGAASLTAA